MKKSIPSSIKQQRKKRLEVNILVFIIFLLGFMNHTFYAQDTIYCGNNNKKVLVCHKGKNTICISINAIQAHLDQGGYLGPCISSECGVSATGGEITCKDTIVTLVAISNTTEVTYSWSGPNNFSSTLATPKTNVPGTYIVTVTDTINECTATDTAFVTQDTLKPGATANGGVITCANTSATLSGSSGISGVIFKWTGPEGYASNQQNAVTSVHGEYILSVTNPLNGCISADTTIIQQNNTAPEDVAATVQDMLTCTQTSVTLTGTSSTSGVTYNWSGPNAFTSVLSTSVVSVPGIYTLTVTDPVNNCSESASVTVEQNTTPPADVTATVSEILTCSDTSVILTGISSTDGVSYNWSGPNAFTSVLSTLVVSVPGIYTLTVTDPVNNCSESASVTIEQDIATPESLTASVSDTLSSMVPSVTLSVSSTTNGITYVWTGPQGFISNEQNTVTVLPGNYSVIATNLDNGCISVKHVTVIKEECQ